ncbi:alpha/beta hydrolase [Serinicoccus profundi]|uniref:alpha/beta hydrolase n=1 Tax=Serinicoccus profundi TaxID=1078471 RepID=UPI000255ED12|nr:alpha/beta hydrolase [Serinicoccus profundi]
MPAPPALDRRTLLALTGGLSLAACAPSNGTRDDGAASGTAGPSADPADAATPTAGRTGRISYGDDPSQWAELQRPEGEARGTVVVIHGGFWREAYGAELGEPLAADLVERGWTTLNVEYRRVGNGGGFPQTFDDVHSALELVDAGGPVVTLGHSAGGHLAAWAAGRLRSGAWPGRVEVTHVLSQAGVLDLASAYRERLGSGAVDDLMGFDPEDPRFASADPAQQLPIDASVWALHAADDEQVPIQQSQDYVAAARAAGTRAELVEVTGGHFDLIDVTTDAWARVVGILDSISPPLT